MRVLIAGGRKDERELLAKWSFNVLLREGRLGSVRDMVGIQGCASGWDTWARQWFISKGCSNARETLLDFPIRVADWDRYGLGAGPVRNRQMLIEGKPELVVAGPGGNGTADMIAQAHAANVEVIDLAREDWFLAGVTRYHEQYGSV